jgi:hypothetical protein
VLVRLAEAGPGPWRVDREAGELMRFAAVRYAALARKWGQEPGDAAFAAFEVMRQPSTRAAGDPWAVVTVAVQKALIAEHRSQVLLCSVARARRADYARFGDPVRSGDRWAELNDPRHQADDTESDAVGEVRWAVDETVSLLVLAGWPGAGGGGARLWPPG